MSFFIFPFTLMTKHDAIDFAVFKFCRFSLYLKDPFSSLYSVATVTSVMLSETTNHIGFKRLLKYQQIKVTIATASIQRRYN